MSAFKVRYDSGLASAALFVQRKVTKKLRKKRRFLCALLN